MTDENHDIEQVEEVEPKVKPSKPGKNEMIVANIVMFIFIFLALSFLIAINLPRHCNLTEQSTVSIAESLLQSLQSATAIYVAQQRKEPKVFSDFVVPEGTASGQYTLTLENLDVSPEYIDTRKMKVTYEGDNVAIYYLSGSDITASFFFDKYFKEVEKDKTSHLRGVIVFFIVVLVLTTIILLYFNYSKRNFEEMASVFALIIVIFILIQAVFPPRFTKPAIYLYPNKPTEVNITLDKRINITLDVPKYAANKGWHVMAYPDSKIVDLQPQYTDCNTLDPNQFGLEYAKKACLNNNYPYIYWEGEPANKTLPSQTKGWLVKTSNIKAFLTTRLDEVGFNESEKAEFIRYWVHKIKASNKESVFISFIETDVIEGLLPMTVTPTPDSINRFYIIVDLNVNAHKNPQPQKLSKFKRDGFTLVDWGGAMVGLNFIR